MDEDFFEGKDYEEGKFKGLMPEYYPPKYKQFIDEETALLKAKVKGANRILEAGVGIGRLIPSLAPLVNEFIGIDTADFMLKTSNEVAKEFSNVKIIHGAIEEVDDLFPENHRPTHCIKKTEKSYFKQYFHYSFL